MEQTSVKSVKDNTRSLLECMEERSGLTYVEGCELKRSDCRIKSYGEIERAVYERAVAMSDFFVLRALAGLSFATIEMVAVLVEHEKQACDDPQIAFPSTEYDAIKKSLARLVGNALANKYEYVAPGAARSYNLYMVTEAGYQCLRKILYYKEPFEGLAALNDVTEILKRVGAAYVGLRLIKSGAAVSFQGFSENGYFKNIGKFPFYGRIFTEVYGQRFVTMLEPFYFNFNPLLIKKGTRMRVNVDRLDVIREYKAVLDAEGKKLRVIAIVEDKKGLIEAVKLLQSASFSREELISMFYFTSRQAVCERKDDLIGSFLKIEEFDANGVPKVRACRQLDFV